MNQTRTLTFSRLAALLTCAIVAPALTNAQVKKPATAKKAGAKGTSHTVSSRVDGTYAPYLGLSKTQEANLTAAVKAFDEQSLAIQRDSKLTSAQKAEQTFQLREKTKDRMADILTPEQKRKLVEIRRKKLADQGMLKKK